jgi:hypothetical protein
MKQKTEDWTWDDVHKQIQEYDEENRVDTLFNEILDSIGY